MATLDNHNLWFDIFDLLGFETQLSLLFTNSCFYNDLFIKNMYDVPDKYLLKLNNFLLTRDIFKNITALNIITRDIQYKEFFKNLKRLSINNYAGLRQQDIQEMDLVEMNISHCHIIYDLSFMHNLKKLMARGYSITQNVLMDLNLTDLRISCNNRIYDVSFMKNLKILEISGDCGIENNGIQGLDLLVLCMAYNKTITDVSHMRNLKILRANNTLLTQSGINGLDLIKLEIGWNNYINDLSFMHNLKKLDVRGSHEINQKSILGLNLITLKADYCPYIIDVSYMTNLKNLYAQGCCGIDDKGIRGLEFNILDNRGNNKITQKQKLKSYLFNPLTEKIARSSI